MYESLLPSWLKYKYVRRKRKRERKRWRRKRRGGKEEVGRIRKVKKKVYLLNKERR